MKMPFGKYKGEEMEDVPEEYIRYALENFTGLSTALIKEMEDQLVMREGHGRVLREER